MRLVDVARRFVEAEVLDAWRSPRRRYDVRRARAGACEGGVAAQRPCMYVSAARLAYKRLPVDRNGTVELYVNLVGRSAR